MADIEVLLPKMGESVQEATITTWLKSVGDNIDEEESLVEIATDKVDSEVPAPATGVIKEILVEEGDVAQIGQAIAIIGAEGDSAPSTPAAPAQKTEAPKEATVAAQAVTEAVASTSAPVSSDGRFYSPLVKTIAAKEGISQTELDNVAGSGANGRVTKADILSHLENRGNTQAPSAVKADAATQAAKAAPQPSKPATTHAVNPIAGYSGEYEIIEMDRMRKLISDHMVNSVQTSPHVTSYVEADVTNLVMWRNKMKNQFLAQEGEKLTFTPIFIEALVKAIKDFPMINVSVDGSTIYKKKDINVGMATALPSGNLIVPVIKHADRMNLTGIAKTVNDLAGRARENKLQPDEISGGTYTITNVGTFGNVLGTPIINQPQVGIMAVGAIRKKPVVVETPQGDSIAIRHMMFLSHSYDHRVVDGALGGSFVRRFGDYLESFDINREI